MTPLERAARALAVEFDRQDGGGHSPDEVHFKEGLTLDFIDQHNVDCGALVRAVLTAIREPSEEFAATLACALADSGAPNGHADVSGANQEQGVTMAAWMSERGFTLVKYPRDMVIDAALSDAAP